MKHYDNDLTAKARIRDAAMASIGAHGVSGTSMRAIAAEAGVSLGLVTHHFGSKGALVAACDRHVASLIRTTKEEAVAEGPTMDILAAIRRAERGPSYARYLARRLTEPSDDVDELVDELVRDAIAYTEDAQRAGLLQPTDDPYGRVVVLLIWSLGGMVLHRHVQRLLGVDLTGDLTQASRYLAPAMEVYGQGVFAPELSETLRRQVADLARAREGQS